MFSFQKISIRLMDFILKTFIVLCKERLVLEQKIIILGIRGYIKRNSQEFVFPGNFTN